MGENKRIAVNTVFVFIRVVVLTLVSLIVSRIALDALGASDYGLYNVVGGIVTFLNVANSAMLSTTYRYIAYEVGKKENGNPQKAFCTSLSIHALFALFILAVGGIVGEVYIDNYLNVLPEKLPDARFVFWASLITASVNTLFIPSQGLLVAKEQFSVTTSVEVITQLLKLGIMVLFIYNAANSLRFYTVVLMGYTIVSGFGYFLYCKRHYGEIVHFKVFKDKHLYKDMFSYAFWTLFGAVSSLCKNQGSAIILNFFYGTIVNAAFAVAHQVEAFIGSFSGTLGQAAVPQITKNFSGGNSKRSFNLTCYMSKYTFIMMLMIAFPVLLETEFLLNLWLKDVPPGAIVFCRLVILSGLISCLGAGIPALVNATGNIRNYQVITHLFILLTLPIAFFLYKKGAGQYTITIVYCIIMFLSAFLKLYLLKRIYGFEVVNFFKVSYGRMFFISIPLLIIYLFYDSSSFGVWGHFAGLILSEILLLGIVYILGLENREKSMIQNTVKQVLHKLPLK